MKTARVSSASAMDAPTARLSLRNLPRANAPGEGPLSGRGTEGGEDVAVMGSSLQADARIDEGEHDVGQQVEEEQEQRIDDDHPEREGEIPLEDRLHEVASHAGDIEDAFHHQGAG